MKPSIVARFSLCSRFGIQRVAAIIEAECGFYR